MSVLVLCKFTPLGFETGYPDCTADFIGVNLPRWGLKLRQISILRIRILWCKFTPLGFET